MQNTQLLTLLTSSAWGIVAAVLVFGVCIFFHEAGHFLAAKASGMRVDAFALGFGPRIFGWKSGETEYSLRWVPVGGFVAIAGMEPGEGDVPRGFHSRPRWMGALVIFAGVCMNVVLAILLFTVVSYTQGEPVPGAKGATIGGISPGTPAAVSGLKVGDRVVAMDGNREGMTVAQVAPGSLAARLGLKPEDRILQVEDNSVAAPTDLLAALQKGARAAHRVVILAANSNDPTRNVQVPPLPALSQASGATPQQAEAALQTALGVTFGPLEEDDLVEYTSLRPGAHMLLTVVRQGQELTVPVNTNAVQEQVLVVDAKGDITTPYRQVGRIGLVLKAPTQPVTLPHAMKIGVLSSTDAVEEVAVSVWAMATGKIRSAPGGPVKIFQMSYESARLGWAEVASFAAFLSANLAVINLFPIIPILDGFALVQLGYEAIRRRRVNARVEYLMKMAGVIVILCLFVALTFNDLRNLIIHGSG
jgi:regulator of sigma E protease